MCDCVKGVHEIEIPTFRELAFNVERTLVLMETRCARRGGAVCVCVCVRVREHVRDA